MHRPIGWIVIFFGLGILFHQWVEIQFIFLWLLVVVGLFTLIILRKKQRIFIALLCLCFFSVGLLHALAYQFLHVQHISSVARFYRNAPMTIHGQIISDVRESKFFRTSKHIFTVDVYQIKTRWGWKESRGKIFIHAFGQRDVSYGDQIVVEGKLHRPYNFSSGSNFSYPKYLANKGVYFVLSVKKDRCIQTFKLGSRSLKSVALNVRNRLKAILEKNLSVNEAGIMKAILLGDRSHIPKHIRELFVRTGTIHILAISGLHIGIIAFIFFAFLKLLPINRRLHLILTIICLIGYSFLTGARPSVLRATLMMVVFLGSFIFERKTDSLNTLGFAAMVLLVFNPFYLFDIGFQLSFICVFCIIILSGQVSQLLFKSNNHLTRSLSVSISIEVGIIGIIAYYFNIITPITILANLVVVPLAAAVVSLGFGVLVTGFWFPTMASLFAVCLKFVLNVMVGSVFLFEKVPFAYFYLQDIRLWHVIIYYIILVFLVSFYKINNRFQIINNKQQIDFKYK